MLFFSLQNGFDLIKLQTNNDTVSSVCILSGFDDPGVKFIDGLLIALIVLRDRVKVLKKL
jgi:hypothetical protein